MCTESLLDSSPVTATPCEMCSNFQAQMVNAQNKIHDLEKHIVSLERYKQELSKETAFRKDMEEKWNEKKEEYKEQVWNPTNVRTIICDSFIIRTTNCFRL